MENENKTETQSTSAMCDICGEQETNVTENLITSGWFIGSREHFCPRCNS